MSQKTIIGSHGGQGSNGTRAFEYAFDLSTHDYKGYKSFEALFDGLVAGEVDQIIIPFEGAIVGGSESVMRPMREAQENGAVFQEEKAFSIPLYYALISARSANMNTVKVVYSHPLAFELCSEYIAAMGLDTREYDDSYSAVEYVVERNRPDEAAIGPIEAVQKFDGQLLKDKIANDDHNMMLYKVFSLA